MEGEGKEPGAVGVTLAVAVAGGDVGAGVLSSAVGGEWHRRGGYPSSAQDEPSAVWWRVGTAEVVSGDGRGGGRLQAVGYVGSRGVGG